MKRSSTHKMRKKHTVRNIFIALVLILFISLGAYAVIAFHNLKTSTDTMYQKSGLNNSKNSNSLLEKHKPISILIMGTDTGALGRNYKGRTDTMMIMTINPKTNKTTLVSIPRDMKVNLPSYPEYSPAKINSAYTYGGIKEAIKTVENHFNIPINFYVLVNMGGLEKAIDEIGGIDVTSPLTFNYLGANFVEGEKQHMDGETALKFTRMRYQDPQGDYGRQERQRLVIEALLKESISPTTVLNQKFLNSISSQMRTNLTLDDMKDLALDYRKATKNIKSTYVKGTDQNIDGISFQVVSLEQRQEISDLIRSSLGLNKVEIKE